MTGHNHELTHIDDIKDLYGGEAIPRLSKEEFLAARALLLTAGYENVAGSVLLDDEKPPKTLKGLIGRDLVGAMPDAFYGPNILGDAYYRNGIAVWAPIQGDA